MIKSSDKQFNNTYRLQRVLANKDYLATDYNHNFYLFCQTPHYLHHYSPRSGNKYLLVHKECIVVDHLKYFVFEGGLTEPIWIGDIDTKRLWREQTILNLVQHAVVNILSWLLWNNPKEAVEFLDIRNCWLTQGRLSIIQLPRFRKVSFSLKRSEHHYSSLNSALFTTIFQTQEALLRHFGLLLWQIIEQRPYTRGDIGTCCNKFIRKLLSDMIHNQIRYEQLENMLKNKYPSTTDKIYQRKSKLRSITLMGIEKRRNNLQQISPLKKYSSFNKSRFQKIYTQVVNRSQPSPPKTIVNVNFKTDCIQKQSISEEVNSVCKGCTYTLVNHPPASLPVNQQKTPNRKNHNFSTIQTNTFGSSTQSTTKYFEWMKSRKHSLDIQKKIQRQEILAQDKFNQAKEEDRTGTINQFDEEKLKLRLLSKVIKFRSQKSSIKKVNNPIISRQINDESSISQKPPLSTVKIQNGEPQLRVDSIIHKQENGKEVVEIKKGESNSGEVFEIPVKKDMKLSIEKVNNYMINPNQLLNTNNKQQHCLYKFINNAKNRQADDKQIIKPPSKQVKSHKKQVGNIILSNQTKIKKENILGSNDDQFQVIILDKIKRQELKSTQPVQNIIFHDPSQAKLPQRAYDQVIDLINQFLTMINILGDITVKSVKIKDKLTILNWRTGSYFLYERFYSQRRHFLKGLKNNSRNIVRKHHINIQNKMWNAWANSPEKSELIKKTEAENVAIKQTLNRFGQKALKQCKIEKKMEHYFQSKEKQQEEKSKYRLELSSLAVKYIVDQFDTMVQKKINIRDIVNHVIDCLFGLRIMRELDGLAKDQIQLDDYKRYKYDLGEASRLVDELYDLYLPDH